MKLRWTQQVIGQTVSFTVKWQILRWFRKLKISTFNERMFFRGVK